MTRFEDRLRGAAQNVRDNIQERREERQERRENRRDNPLSHGELPEGPRARDANQTRPTTQTPGLTQPLNAKDVRLDGDGRIVVTIPLTSEQARQNLYYSYQGQGFSCRPQVTQLQNTPKIESAGRFTIERSNAGGNPHLTVTLDQSLDSLDLRIQGQSVSLNQRELRGVIAAREAQAQAAARDQAARAAHEEARRQKELRQQAEQARQQEARASAVGQVQGALKVLLGQRDVSTPIDNNGVEPSDNTHKIVVQSSTSEEAQKDAAAINQLMRQAGIDGPEVLVVRNELIFDADQIVNYGVDRFVVQFQTISEQVKKVLNVPSTATQPAPARAPEAAAPATPSPQPTPTPSPVPPAPTSPATPSTPEENPTTTPSPPVPDPARAETPSQTPSPEPTPPPSAAATPTTAPENSTTTAPNLVPPASTTPQTPAEPTETQRRTEIQARIRDLQLDHPQQSALLSMLEQLPIEHLPKAQLQLAQLRADMITAQEKTASLRVHPELFRQDLARLAREVTQNILENRNSSLEAVAFRDRNVPVLQSLGYEQSEFLGYWERTTKTETQSITRYINPALGLLEEREVSGSQMTFYKLDSELNRGVTYATSTRGPDGKWAQQPGGFVYKHGGWHDAQSLQRYETVLATLDKHLDTGLTGYAPIWSDSQEEVARALESVPPGSGEYIAQKYKERTGYDLNNVLNWNLDRSHYERAMRQLHGFDAQRQARVLDEALKQDAEWVGFASADVDALLAATANLTPYQAEAIRSEFANIEPNDGPLMPRLVDQLPFGARIKVLDNLGLTNPHEIARLINTNQSADEVLELFKLLSPERRVEVKQTSDQLTGTDLYDRVFVRHTTYAAFNAGATLTEKRTLREDLKPLIEPSLPEG